MNRRIFPLLLSLLIPVAQAADTMPPAAAPYRPLAFLAGHCWKGNLAGGKDVDEHCFSWVYGGRFLRDTHTVRGAGHPDYVGETIYFLDSAAKQVQYLYIENGGGISRGSVAVDGDTLVFPDAQYVSEGETQIYRSRWQRKGEDAYDVTTEFKMKDGWARGFSGHMVRSN
jgi:hypothetical protein